jgi:membrane protein YqaA with SNARE-associated domain
MEEFVAWLQPLAERFGGVGMAIVAMLDSSFVSMPNVNDLLIVWQTIQHPDRWWYYALMTSAGSVVGSMAIYWIGRKSGEAFLNRRFKAEHVARVRGVFERYGMVAMLVVAILPPPAPYKIFVLLAGAGGVGPLMFALAVAIGRGIRYGLEGWLARVYGEVAAAFVRDNLTTVSIWLGGGALAAIAVFVVWRRRWAA